MHLVAPIFSFILGLIVGSFLNVVIIRLHQGRALTGRSACPHCHRELSVQDLVPVVSFMLLSGRCRYCRKKLSLQYPLVELATGVSFFLLARSLPVDFTIASFSGVRLLFDFFFACLLIVIFTFDLRYYLIPDFVVLIGIIGAVIVRLAWPGGAFLDGTWGALSVAGFFGVLYLFSRGTWIGLGDVKLGVFLGFLLGLKLSLLMLLLAYISGAVVGVTLVLLGRRTMQGVLPFGTFLTAASLILMIWGVKLLGWYERMLYF